MVVEPMAGQRRAYDGHSSNIIVYMVYV